MKNHDTFTYWAKMVISFPFVILIIIYHPIMWALGTTNYVRKTNDFFNDIFGNHTK